LWGGLPKPAADWQSALPAVPTLPRQLFSFAACCYVGRVVNLRPIVNRAAGSTPNPPPLCAEANPGRRFSASGTT
jgi:hypothetical protein